MSSQESENYVNLTSVRPSLIKSEQEVIATNREKILQVQIGQDQPMDFGEDDMKTVPNLEDVRNRIRTLVADERYGMPVASKILSQFGVEAASQLDPMQYPIVLKEIDKYLRQGEAL